MFVDYTKLVLQEYETKRAVNALSIALVHPSPAKLKDECDAVCNNRYERKKDEIALHGFFGIGYDKAAVLKEIGRCDIDKFKPLVNFLRKGTVSTDQKNIELLAWLIDFRERPFEYGKKYPDRLDFSNDPAENSTETVSERFAQTTSSDRLIGVTEKPQQVALMQQVLGKPGFNFKMLATFIIVITLGLIGIIIYHKETGELSNIMGAPLNSRGACMYWTGDHYQQIPCNQKVYGAIVIALDSEKLVHFKKITTPDTLTEADINRVFYIKHSGKIEFYTGGGIHPLYSERNLKPLTPYIYEKYILPLKH